MNIFEELLPLVLFMTFGLFTFILPILRQRQKLKKKGEINKRGKDHKDHYEEKDEYLNETHLRLERDRMREKLGRRYKSAEIPGGNLVSDSYNPAAEKKETVAAIVYKDPFPAAISSLSPLKKAVILSEILGKPKGLEEY